MSWRKSVLYVLPLEHASTKFKFALWQDSICIMIYFYLWYAKYTWNTRYVIELKISYSLEPWFHQMIEASRAVSTRSTGAVQPAVSFFIYSFIHYHLPYTLSKTENESMINKSTSQTQKSELSCTSNLKNTVSDCWGIWVFILGILLMQCFIHTHEHTCTLYQRANKAHLCLERETM